MILNIPHSSTGIPDSVDASRLPEEYFQELITVTDWHVRELFVQDSTVSFTGVMISDLSRLFCDVERLNPDPLEVLGRGHRYTKFLSGNPFNHTFTKEMCDEYYTQYHRNFSDLITQTLPYYNCYIVDCHTFNDGPLPYEKGHRYDFCLGINPGDRVPVSLIDKLINTIVFNGFTVGINEPYEGSFKPMGYMDSPFIKSVMIDVNKRIFMNDDMTMSSYFIRARNTIQELLTLIDEEEGNWNIC